jgi:hypothetical protein
MNRLKYISFTIPKEKIKISKNMLRDLDLGVPIFFENENHAYLPTSHSIVLSESSPKLKMLLNRLIEMGIDKEPFVRNERKYTQSEINNADLFWIHVNNQIDDGYNVYGTKFGGPNVCTKCGSGEVQESELILKTQKFKKMHFSATFNFEYIVSAALANAIRNDYLGINLLPIFDYKSYEKSNLIFQFLPENNLPTLVEPTKISKSSLYCSSCGKNGLFIETEMHIKKTPDKVADAYFTKELFGEKRNRACPGPELVLSKRLITKIKEFDKRALRIEPVFLDDQIFKF